jgi:hypothetical protein
MSSDALPDDVRAWPSDPHALLGVAGDVDGPALRRAYHGLIRRFNPERFPEQFMRIRAAYERLQQIIAYREWTPDETPDDPQPVVTISTPKTDLPDAPREPPAEAVAMEAWQRAIEGNLGDAYRTLCGLYDRQAGDDTLCLQLYWLHRTHDGTLDPELDADRRPEDWLVTAVRRYGARSPAWWIYLQVLELSPAEAVSVRCTSLLSLPALRAHLRPLLAQRWRVASSSDRWDLIRDDLETLRSARSANDDRTRMHILFLALDYAAWSFDPVARDVVRACSDELSRFVEFELEAPEAFDRAAQVREMTEHNPWIVRPDTRRLWELVRDSWNRPADRLRDRVVEAVDGWVDSPLEALELLDDFGRGFQQHLGVLHDLFRELAPYEPWVSDEERVRRDHPVIVPALEGAPVSDYAMFRAAILNLAIQESLTVDRIIAVGLSALPDMHWCRELYEDLPLRTLLAGLSAYWAN